MSTKIPSYIKGSFIIISLRSYLGSYASIGRCGHYITYHDGHIATDLLSRPSTDVNAPWHRHRPVVLKGVHLLSIMGNAETFQRSVRQICTDTEIVYHVIYLIFCFLGLSTHPFFFSVLLFDVVYREETLLNVIRSVTRNGRSIVLTAVLALILFYMFSIIGYLLFSFIFI